MEFATVMFSSNCAQNVGEVNIKDWLKLERKRIVRR